MLRIVVLALVAGGFLPSFAQAQALASQPVFGFCSVTDTSSAQAKIWASPVLVLEHADIDPTGLQRVQTLATDFLAHVGTLGGRGDKSCVVLPTRAEAEVFREQQRAIWDKRMFMIKVGDWRDVAWTPPPWQPAAATAAPVNRYFFCQATQVHIPDRSDLARTVVSGVFARPVPQAFEAANAQTQSFTGQFQILVQAHGLPPAEGTCTAYDTPAEAQYAQDQARRLFKGFNMKYTEVAWEPMDAVIAPAAEPSASHFSPAVNAAPSSAAPSDAATLSNARGARDIGILYMDAVTPELQQTLALPSLQGVFVAAAAPDSSFRHMDVLLEIAGQAIHAPAEVAATLGRLRPGFRAPVRVWRERAMQEFTVVVPEVQANPAATVVPSSASLPAGQAAALKSPAAPSVEAIAGTGAALYCAAAINRAKPPLMLRVGVWEASAQTTQAAGLEQLIAAVRRQYADGWYDFPGINCSDNSAIFPGETVCVSSGYKHFRGSQIAVQYCNRSREILGKRWQDMQLANGDIAIFSWPPAS